MNGASVHGLPFEVRSLIDAETGQHFSALLDVAGTTAGGVPYTNAKNESTSIVALVADTETDVHSFSFAGQPGQRIVCFFAQRCSRPAFPTNTSTHLRYRLKMDGVQLGAEGAMDIPWNEPGALTPCDATGTIFAVAILTDNATHTFEASVEAVAGPGSADEGEHMVLR